MEPNWKFVIIALLLVGAFLFRDKIAQFWRARTAATAQQSEVVQQEPTPTPTPPPPPPGRAGEMDAASNISRDVGTQRANVSGVGAAQRARKTLSRDTSF